MKRLLSAAILCLAATATQSCGPGPSDLETRYRVAGAYGLEAFDQVEQIRFTLNVRKDGRRFRRSWVWHPRADSVIYNDAIRYSRTDTILNYNTDTAQVDRWFVNDQTWLLFPLQLAWDGRLTITEDEVPQPLPTGKGRAHRLTVTYPELPFAGSEVYQVYIGDDDRILAWTYHAGGGDEPTDVTTWEDHRHVGPITVSLERHSPDGNYRVWFTDVAVKLEGQDTWLEAR